MYTLNCIIIGPCIFNSQGQQLKKSFQIKLRIKLQGSKTWYCVQLYCNVQLIKGELKLL